jgi:hypothetical protein
MSDGLTGWQAVTLGLGSAGVGAVASLLGVVFSGRIQRGHQTAAARRQAAAADHERLRGDYAALLALAQVWVRITKESSFVMQGETTETRDARLASLLGSAAPPAQSARIRLAMESTASDVVSAYDATWDAYLEYRLSQSDPAGLERAEHIRKSVTALENAVKRLEDSARKHLTSLAMERS